MARHFQYKAELFFRGIIDGLLRKQNIMLYALNFKKGVNQMSIRLYEFSMQQIFITKLLALS